MEHKVVPWQEPFKMDWNLCCPFYSAAQLSGESISNIDICLKKLLVSMKGGPAGSSGSSCLPFTRRTHLSKHLALPSTGQCLPEQPWREHPGTLLCFRSSTKHESTCCLSNNEFLVSGLKNPPNCEAESCMEQGEFWITLQRAREHF